MSAFPVPSTSAAATLTPPVKPRSNAYRSYSSVPSDRNTRTTGGPPGPAPVMISSWPSPSTSPLATLTPPESDELPAMNCTPGPPDVEKVRTCGPPPEPGPVMIRATAVGVGPGGTGVGLSGAGAHDAGELSGLLASTGPLTCDGCGPPGWPHQFERASVGTVAVTSPLLPKRFDWWTVMALGPDDSPPLLLWTVEQARSTCPPSVCRAEP